GDALATGTRGWRSGQTLSGPAKTFPQDGVPFGGTIVGRQPPLGARATAVRLPQLLPHPRKGRRPLPAGVLQSETVGLNSRRESAKYRPLCRTGGTPGGTGCLQSLAPAHPQSALLRGHSVSG